MLRTREGIVGSEMRGGKAVVEASRILGAVRSAERSRCFAVAARALREGRLRLGGGMRMGARKEGCGVGRLRAVMAVVSWGIVGAAIFYELVFLCGWRVEVTSLVL